MFYDPVEWAGLGHEELMVGSWSSGAEEEEAQLEQSAIIMEIIILNND